MRKIKRKSSSVLPLPSLCLCGESFSAQRRPFFLLEIIIAIALVGIFAMGFLGSGVRYLAQERKALLELEFGRERDRVRMETIARCWEEIQTLQKYGPWDPPEKPLRVKLGGKEYTTSYRWKAVCKTVQDDHVLVLQEGTQKYYFLIKKADALSK